MPQKIHPWNTRNRPALGRISCLTESRSRPIQAEPVHLELANTVTYGGAETAQYPLSIYRPWFRKFFTFAVPLAAVSYYPGLAILGREDRLTGSPAWFQCASPLIGVLFLAAALRVWRIGVRHYRSTGS